MIDWFDLLVVQGTLKSILQQHSSKALILWCSAFFMVQFSHPDMTTRKTIALTIWTFVGKVMSLFFNMLTRFVMTFLPKSKCLLISWLQSLSTGILEPKKIKSVTTSNFSPLDLVQMTISSIKSWEIYFKLPLLLFLSFFPLHWQKFFFLYI